MWRSEKGRRRGERKMGEGEDGERREGGEKRGRGKERGEGRGEGERKVGKWRGRMGDWRTEEGERELRREREEKN
jgi:hypothetical protein